MELSIKLATLYCVKEKLNFITPTGFNVMHSTLLGHRRHQTKVIHIGHLTPCEADNNYEIHWSRTNHTWQIKWAEKREHKKELLRQLVSQQPSPTYKTW